MTRRKNKLAVVLFAGFFSACSTVKDMTNVDLWPFGKGGDQGHEYLPANSVAYTCDGNKKFYVRYLDKGASVWLILPDREVALAQIGSSKVYSNGISKLDLTSDQVILEVNETTKYVGCKANAVASVSKVEAKPASVAQTESKSEAKSVAKAEAKTETSEKSWFDWMKFWESDDKPKQAAPAKVTEPAPVVAKEEPPVAKISEAKVLEPVEEAPKAELVFWGAGEGKLRASTGDGVQLGAAAEARPTSFGGQHWRRPIGLVAARKRHAGFSHKYDS